MSDKHNKLAKMLLEAGHVDEAVDVLKAAVGGIEIPKKVLDKIDGWTFEVPINRLFSKARKSPLSKPEMQKVIKSLQFEVKSMQPGEEKDKKEYVWLLNTMKSLLSS